jgi:hypothetical protein
MRWPFAAVVLSCTLPSCSVWFFSGDEWIDRTRPVVLVETTGGIEFGAATEFGVLTLGRSAEGGPCRVHYFLGPTPIVESGVLEPTTTVFTRAAIDLKTQQARALDRAMTEDDRLTVLWTPDGRTTRKVRVALARGEGLTGELLADPGEDLPAGATLLCRGEDGEALFAGLIAGRATVSGGSTAGRYYLVAGPDRVRELLAVPSRHPVDEAPVYRADDISVMKPIAPGEPKPDAPIPDAPNPTGPIPPAPAPQIPPR